jgi:Uma2 family endonuclease
MFKKIHQYLGAGSEVVWVVYPSMKVIAVHDHTGVHEFRQGFLEAGKLLPGFRLSLAEIFDDDLLK